MSHLRITIQEEHVPDPRDAAEELVSDVLDHEGRYVLWTELRLCICGSADGYTLPGGEVTCADCMGYAVVEVSELSQRRFARRRRDAERRPAA